MKYEIIDGRLHEFDKNSRLRSLDFEAVTKSLKLYDNLRNHILILTEELANYPSTQLRYLLEEFVKVRDE